nr:SGNH/GDSL hydrolase family protein [Clostridia bacterium]
MKILFYGDSITDMGRDRESEHPAFKMGVGYPNFIAGELHFNEPNRYEIVNRGISGNRIVDLYARIKVDVWNHNPDVLSILIGVNDVWHEWSVQNGVEIERWEKVYRMLIEDTKKQLPDLKIIICEPFILEGEATDGEERWKKFLEVKDYAKVAKKIAEDYGAYFVPLQDKFDEAAQKYGVENYLYDGVHPAPAGAKLIATEWMKVFEKIK